MARKKAAADQPSNNPRPVPSARCGCPTCQQKKPGDRPTVDEHTGSWEARYTDPKGKERSKTKPTYDQAVAFLEQTRTEMRQRVWIDPARGEITLGAWWRLWWPTQTKGEARIEHWTQSQLRDEASWRNHIAPTFASAKLFEVEWRETQLWVNALHDENGGPLAASSVTKVFQVLDRMLEDAKRDRRLPFNPAEGVKLPTIKKKHPEERRPPSYAQLWLIRQKLPEYMHALLIVAQETGLRFQELAGLRWCNVDFDGRRIHVREVLVEPRGKIKRKEYPKSDAGLRSVPLTGLAARVLRDLWAEESAEGSPSRAVSEPKDGLREEELVFHGRNKVRRGTKGIDGVGEAYRAPLRRSAFRRLWTDAIEKAGVVRKKVRTVTVQQVDEDTGRRRPVKVDRTDWWPDFHDTRHAFASRLHARGVPEVITQEILGHERAGEVTWIYTHAAADYPGQVLAALEDGKPGAKLPRQRKLRVIPAA
ncbi:MULTISPECIES: site-specific integrase [unclassified Streptomyces]|uniref:tyrosine-type recombinase/integrase n=1 Tax=unclassified Streptomyces TaxID=2593676 RepID=UPI0019098966|nr:MULTISPECIES: site-specific integrase [unclassified Streptomyces]MBK3563178.1 site-specific integrase [Streptomyces sp. MBT62]MBK6013167.1 site-specific integrase [Streptomyces sp. MBT53]